MLQKIEMIQMIEMIQKRRIKQRTKTKKRQKYLMGKVGGVAIIDSHQTLTSVWLGPLEPSHVKILHSQKIETISFASLLLPSPCPFPVSVIRH